MSASKKDYEAIAAVLNKVAREHDLSEQQCFVQVVMDLGALFTAQNPRFKMKRWAEAVWKDVPVFDGSGGRAAPKVTHAFVQQGPSNPYCARCSLPRMNGGHG